MQCWEPGLTLDELGGLGALQPLEQQDEYLLPVLSNGLPGRDTQKTTWHITQKPTVFFYQTKNPQFGKFELNITSQTDVVLHSRWHVLDDAVEQVETLVVVGLGGN